jgi:hypothetical protein
MVAGLPPGSRYFGGERFDCNFRRNGVERAKRDGSEAAAAAGDTNEDEDDEWRAFGGHRFVLPVLELSAEVGQGPVLAVNLAWAAHDSRGGGAVRLSPSASTSSSSAPSGSGEASTLAEAASRAAALLARVPAAVAAAGHPPPAAPQPPARVVNNAGDEEGSSGRVAWRRQVRAALREIGEGMYGKVVLARRAMVASGDGDGIDALELAASLRHDRGHLFLFDLLDQSGGSGACAQPAAFVGCTPEQLFEVGRGGEVATMAVAGTRPRGSTAAEDARLGEDLLASAKDMAESKHGQSIARLRPVVVPFSVRGSSSNRCPPLAPALQTASWSTS